MPWKILGGSWPKSGARRSWTRSSGCPICFPTFGIRHASQLRTHPLRGAVFESWIITEIVKARLHRGVRGNEFFYRDRSSHEVDLVLSAADHTSAVEIESARTVSSEFLVALRRFTELMTGAGVPERVETHLVYGGEEGGMRGETSLVPWATMADFPWAEH